MRTGHSGNDIITRPSVHKSKTKTTTNHTKMNHFGPTILFFEFSRPLFFVCSDSFRWSVRDPIRPPHSWITVPQYQLSSSPPTQLPWLTPVFLPPLQPPLTSLGFVPYPISPVRMSAVASFPVRMTSLHRRNVS